MSDQACARIILNFRCAHEHDPDRCETPTRSDQWTLCSTRIFWFSFFSALCIVYIIFLVIFFSVIGCLSAIVAFQPPQQRNVRMYLVECQTVENKKRYNKKRNDINARPIAWTMKPWLAKQMRMRAHATKKHEHTTTNRKMKKKKKYNSYVSIYLVWEWYSKTMKRFERSVESNSIHAHPLRTVHENEIT